MSPSSERAGAHPGSVLGPNQDTHRQYSSSFALALAALGIIYGDIGTSPLYTIRECFAGSHGIEPSPTNILGIMSLVFLFLSQLAIQLGFAPRVHIIHTSAQSTGQISLPTANGLLPAGLGLLHHLKHTEALQEQVVLLPVGSPDLPAVLEARNAEIERHGQELLVRA